MTEIQKALTENQKYNPKLWDEAYQFSEDFFKEYYPNSNPTEMDTANACGFYCGYKAAQQVNIWEQDCPECNGEEKTCHSECGMRMRYGISCNKQDCKHIRKCGTCKDGKVPRYLTPEQYKAETGREWIGPVWYLATNVTEHYYGWYLRQYAGIEISTIHTHKPCLCASNHGQPPDDYRSEAKG